MNEHRKLAEVGKAKKKAKNPLLAAVAAAVAVLLVFGAVTGVILAVREARSVVKYGGIRMDEGVAAYLAATFKTSYISYLTRAGVEVYDDEYFWASEHEDGVTYGELLREATESYIREVAVAAHLYSRYSSLTSGQKRFIKQSAAEVLEYTASGDEDRFNELCEPMGFDYDDFVKATRLLYMASNAKSLIWGDGGELLRAGGYTAECEEYLSTYRYVKLLFIRTEWDYKTNEKGEPVRDAAGNFLTEELSAEERAERLVDLAAIRDAIRAYENGGNDQMSPEYFQSFLKKYDYDDFTLSGYYFNERSEYTAGFSEYVGDEVLTEVFAMNVGEYREVETKYGICFVYRDEVEPYAYLSDLDGIMFGDFFSDAADHLYSTALTTLEESVTVKDEYYEAVDPVSTPYNYEFVVKEVLGS